MKNLKQTYVVQRTDYSGQWHDIASFNIQDNAEFTFKMWAMLKSDFFFVRMISREICEEEILLDHVSGGE